LIYGCSSLQLTTGIAETDIFLKNQSIWKRQCFPSRTTRLSKLLQKMKWSIKWIWLVE